MATIVVLNIYLALILLILFLLRAPLRKIGAAYILCSVSSLALLGIFYMMIRDGVFNLSPALFTIPWPAAPATPSVPALAYDCGTDWNRILKYFWLTGMGASALIMLLRLILFRRRILASQSPAPQRVLDAAKNVFSSMETASLMAKYPKASANPSEEELEEAANPTLPRIYLSSAVDGPIMLSFPQTLILPDNANYSDEQLAFLLRLVYHICEGKSTGSYKVFYLFNQCAGWFNPLLPLFRRAGDVHERTKLDYLITRKFTPEEKAEYLGMLESLACKQPSSLHYFRLVGGEAEIALRREQVNTSALKDFVREVAGFALITALLIGMTFLIQPPNAYPVNEESVFSILGEKPSKLYSERLAPVPLISTEEDGMLYGTPHYSATSNSTVDWLNFQYPPNTPLEEVEANYQRIYDALTARLGEPKMPLKVTGSLLNAANSRLPLPQEDDLLRHEWTLQTRDGEDAFLVLKLYPDGAYKNEEVKGGPYIDLALH